MLRSAEGERLDRVLSGLFPVRSRAFLQRCIRERRVTVNEKYRRPADAVHQGDHIRIAWPPPKRIRLVPEEIPLAVLAEDDDILVINKSPGLVVHPNDAYSGGTLVHALLHHDPDSFRELVDANLRPGIVHRLDKDTSGAMVVAKHLDARRFLKDAFKERNVEKTYLTIVIGEFGAVTGTIRGPIGRHPRRRTKMAVLPESGKRAVTHYRVLGQGNGVSLLEVRIETGRTHQIRIHFANVDHPVLGDALYGGKQKDLAFRVKRQMLHAWKLAIPHPRTGKMTEYMAPPPADFCTALRELGLPVIGEELP
mgnify:CR=1 FL=1